MSIESANAEFILKQGRVILRAIVCVFQTNDLLLHFMYDREKANIATAFHVTSKCWIALPRNIHTETNVFASKINETFEIGCLTLVRWVVSIRCKIT